MTRDSDDPTDLIEADTNQSPGITPAPSDNTTLTTVVEGLQAEGYTSQLTAWPESQMHCAACGVASAAASFDVHGVRRMEGASDPADMVGVVAATCPNCSTPGLAVLAYGPNASDTDADVMVALDLGTRRHVRHGLGEPR